MRRIDETPLDPEIAAQLDAIDATLAGEPVDPEHAELAELALLLAASRPSVQPEFARSLDQRVARRFAHSPERPAARAQAGPWHWRGSWRWRGSWLGPLAGLGTAATAAIVAVVVVSSAGGGSSTASVPGPSTLTTASGSAPGAASPSASGSGGTTSSSAASSARSPAAASSAPASRPPSREKAAPSATFGLSQGALNAPTTQSASAPQPLPNGRKVIQSAQLALSATSAHIDAVAQELFDVVGRENGYVNNSTVTAGSGGYAQFELSVPSSALQATMTALSQLQYATVAARTDATQDVNGQYLSDQRKLTDDRALRTSLLKQLANAATQQRIDSLNAQIHDAEASIRSDESTLRGLNHQIDYSGISVTINGAPAPVSHHHSSGFTLGRAAHDAGRVLTVAAGVALITLAALLPVALLAALAWWIAVAARRRRRDQALDLV